ncbi:hypothetical protein [Pyrococcus kukulkanii]|uniref:hypothetical protein n=1 Tax=Pyrococcus kukulkanii TaxID=1609559 RepID=UPI00356B006B
MENITTTPKNTKSIPPQTEKVISLDQTSAKITNKNSQQQNDLLQIIAEFLEEYREPISEVLKAYAKKIEQQEKNYYWGFIIVLMIVVAIVATIYVLAVKNKLSSDAIGFLLGTIIGYVFSLLDRMLGKQKR